MALNKRTYTDGQTVIIAQNLNDIQDEVIANTGARIPTGGTTGQFLRKKSSTNYDCEWVTVPSASGVNF